MILAEGAIEPQSAADLHAIGLWALTGMISILVFFGKLIVSDIRESLRERATESAENRETEQRHNRDMSERLGRLEERLTKNEDEVDRLRDHDDARKKD